MTNNEHNPRVSDGMLANWIDEYEIDDMEMKSDLNEGDLGDILYDLRDARAELARLRAKLSEATLFKTPEELPYESPYDDWSETEEEAAHKWAKGYKPNTSGEFILRRFAELEPIKVKFTKDRDGNTTVQRVG